MSINLYDWVMIESGSLGNVSTMYSTEWYKFLPNFLDIALKSQDKNTVVADFASSITRMQREGFLVTGNNSR